MATKTAGTNSSTGLTALQWQPGGLNAADLATIQEMIKGPKDVTGMVTSCRIENGIFYFPYFNPKTQGIALQPGDWIVVDSSTGWPSIIPNSVFTASTVWTHS